MRRVYPQSVRASLILMIVLAGGVQARAGILLQDDFNDNSIDPSKWTVTLPFGSSSVIEQNQRMEIGGRGYLTTKQQFNPSAVGGLHITGTWTFTNATWPGHDMMQVLTRSDGVPGGSYGETQNGIEFHANGNDFILISERVGGNATTLAEAPIPINDNESFHFDIRDDGSHLYFAFNKVGGGASAVLTATDPLAFGTNYLVFHDREYNNGYSTLSFLDDVVVETAVPEPATRSLLGAGTIGLLGYRCRRRAK